VEIFAGTVLFSQNVQYRTRSREKISEKPSALIAKKAQCYEQPDFRGPLIFPNKKSSRKKITGTSLFAGTLSF